MESKTIDLTVPSDNDVRDSDEEDYEYTSSETDSGLDAFSEDQERIWLCTYRQLVEVRDALQEMSAMNPEDPRTIFQVMGARLLNHRRNTADVLISFFMSMLQTEIEGNVAACVDADQSPGHTHGHRDRPTDGHFDLDLDIEFSSDSNSSEWVKSIINSDLDSAELIPSTSEFELLESSSISSDNVISDVAQILSKDTVSYLVKENLRYKVSSRVSVSGTASVDHTPEPHNKNQAPTKEDLERKERRKKFNREWAKRDRHRKKSEEENLKQRIESLEEENQELEREISSLKEEARELKACFYLHQKFYHPESEGEVG